MNIAFYSETEMLAKQLRDIIVSKMKQTCNIYTIVIRNVDVAAYSLSEAKFPSSTHPLANLYLFS